MLYKSFYLDKRDTEEEITKEYFKKIKNPDIDEGVYNDLELDQIFNIVNRTYSDVGKEYMYGQRLYQTIVIKIWKISLRN